MGGHSHSGSLLAGEELALDYPAHRYWRGDDGRLPCAMISDAALFCWRIASYVPCAQDAGQRVSMVMLERKLSVGVKGPKFAMVNTVAEQYPKERLMSEPG